ncbi:hypothetical protein DB30_02436 [Enhygromyxa salina]|uniref:Copper type II ascorbate-dependent monooxygenase C-terminal domain-containing protein n=1 Tax=Enhygromyxa salina TaxID=215803 RepID=A0A0C1Z2T3_9BACT|nr:hypothetical protein DB30_02436 [Enhygromyxa salina]
MVLLVTLGACEQPPDSDTSGQDDAATERPNWHEDVAPLIHARCVGCHRDGGVGPFALDTYASAAPWADLVETATTSMQMPPWGAQETEACHPRHAWENDPRLNQAELELLADWAALGAPEGDPAQAAPLPAPTDRDLADPSDIFELPAPIEVPAGVDSFACVSIDPGLDDEVWITGVQLIPDNEQVVHHVLIMLDATGASAGIAGVDGTYPCEELHLGTMLGSYFPGSAPTRLPEGAGVPFPAGARIVLAFHYHPTTAGSGVDQSSLAVRWTAEAPDYDALISTLGNATSAAGGLLPGPNDPQGEPAFHVPAGAKNHTETMQLAVPPGLPDGTRLFMLGPHMHDVGTEIRMTHARDGDEQCMIHDPAWNPDWQSVYAIEGAIEELPTLIEGDVLTMQCTYDNSLDNPRVVEALAGYGLDSPITVTMGSAALDEMCMFVYGLAVPR